MHPRETCDFAQRCASPAVFTNALSFPGPPIRVCCAEHEQPVQGSRPHASHPHELGRVHSCRSTSDRKSDLAVLKILTELFRPPREKRGVVKSERERERVCVCLLRVHYGGLAISVSRYIEPGKLWRTCLQGVLRRVRTRQTIVAYNS